MALTYNLAPTKRSILGDLAVSSLQDRMSGAPSSGMKAKFREALDRKKAHAGRESSAEGESKVHDSHGPAAAQRMFRRKSGG